MEVVQDRRGSDINAEYEMIQDGAPSSSSMNEDGQAMDYSALSSQPEADLAAAADGEEGYEVTMEEYRQEGDMMSEEAEGEMVDASSLANAGDEEDEEAMMNDDEGYEAEEEGTIIVEEVVEGERDEQEQEAIEGEDIDQHDHTEAHEPEQVITDEVDTKPAIVEKVEVVETSAPEDIGEGGAATEATYEEIQIESNQKETVEEEIEAEKSAQPDTIETVDDDNEEGEEVHAPPSVRVTFNGQDFVLFPHSEPSTYMSAQQEEPITAPRLKADPNLFYESMDTLFEALRVKDSLGDFLEEGTELQVNFIDLQLVLREDDIYAKEVSLNDLHRLHLGLGLTSSLHLTISETARFITRYNELAAHATTVFGQAAQGIAEADPIDHQESEVLEGIEDEQGQEEEYHEEETGHGDEEEQPEGEELITEAVILLEDVNDGEEEGVHGVEADQYEGETLSLNKEEVASLEASVPHQNYEEEEEGEGEEVEGEDIVDYDEAYQSDHEKGVNGDAEYEPEEEAETEEIQEAAQDYEDNKPLRQKRSLDDDDDGPEAVESNDTDSKRVKVDVN